MEERMGNSRYYEESKLKQYFIDDPTYSLPNSTVHINANDQIVKENEDSDHIYIITSGIAIEKQGNNILHLLTSNNFIGLGTIFQKSNASEVVALTEMELVEIDTKRIIEKLRERSYGMEILIDVLNSRILELAERYNFSQAKEERVWQALYHLAVANGQRSENGSYVIPSFSKKMMGSYLHLTASQVNAVYKSLIANGCIRELEEEVILYPL
ncbi:Crp/Fnr family transcriptional regulator [Listeria rustica]|uniref:Crp/Fnr family transcriptional regulator n=1 Tax=Listeria rustica TaxID=2713503 RepID=A0A7W1T508_9LIST|nr:Crp/Fnr family transcriptional regulator [Listeria rustica]MBA3925431.1 Crp/Fnr family transcriptional regulator [Listeria rustica]